jgi:hypothetical protein
VAIWAFFSDVVFRHLRFVFFRRESLAFDCQIANQSRFECGGRRWFLGATVQQSARGSIVGFVV